MPETKLIEKFLTETSPAIVLMLGMIWGLYRLGALYITKWFDRVAPIQERTALAVEKLAGVAERVAETMVHNHESFASAIQAAHARLDDLETPES